MMNAIVYSRASTIKMVQMPIPKLENGWYTDSSKEQCVIVRVNSAGLNPVDAKYLYGDKIPKYLQPSLRYLIDNKKCGFDFSGIVSEVPSDCIYKVGDKVFGIMAPTATSGTFAEYIKAPINSVCMKPNNLSFAEAGCLPLVGITALQSLDDNQLQSGMHVLIIGGSGGVGHIGVQLAKLRGAKVTAICSRRNVKFIEKLNADLVIAYDETDDILIDLNKAVNTLGKIDIVFDTVTSNETHDSKFSYEKTICDSSALFGAVRRYIKIGGSPGDWALAHFKRFLGIDLFPKDRELFWIRMSNSSEYLKMLCSYCESNTLKPVVALHVPFTEKDILEAFNQIRNRHMVGKIVIDVIPSENGKT